MCGHEYQNLQHFLLNLIFLDEYWYRKTQITLHSTEGWARCASRQTDIYFFALNPTYYIFFYHASPSYLPYPNLYSPLLYSLLFLLSTLPYTHVLFYSTLWSFSSKELEASVYKIDKDKKELIERAEDFEQMAMRRLEKVGEMKRGDD